MNKAVETCFPPTTLDVSAAIHSLRKAGDTYSAEVVEMLHDWAQQLAEAAADAEEQHGIKIAAYTKHGAASADPPTRRLSTPQHDHP